MSTKKEKLLSGEMPITRENLLVLVNSWGRLESFNVKDSNNQTLKIEYCEPKECYDLFKLDTSEITDMSSIFRNSYFNGDISNWNTSNVTGMERMFYNAIEFNQALNFDTSNVTNISYMFYNARKFNQPLNFDTSKVTSIEGMFYSAEKFNQPINFDTSNVTSMISMFSYARIFNQPINFDTSKVISMYEMFNEANAFKDKYNNGKTLLDYTEDIKEWLNDNRDRMNDIDLKEKHGEEVDNFFTNITNLTKEIKSKFNGTRDNK